MVIHHFSLAFFPSIVLGDLATAHSHWERLVYGTPLDLIVAGNFAVSIFFVLSGFVLSYKFFHGQGHSVVVSSAIRRYLRLMPAVLGSVILAYTLMKLGLFYNLPLAPTTHSQAWLGTFWNFAPSLSEALKQGVIGTFVDGTSSYNSSLWTMHYEFFGSFIVFGFLSLFGKLRNRQLLYGLAALAFYNNYFLAFIIGVWLCDNLLLIRRTVDRLGARWLPWLVMVAGLAFGTVPIPSPRYQLNLHLIAGSEAMALLHIIGAGLLLLGIVCSPAVQFFLSRRPILFLGRISFSLYLLHVIILGSFSTYLFSLLDTGHSYYVAAGLTFLVSIVLILLVSNYYTRWVDDRAIVWSGRFYRRFFTSVATTGRAADPALDPTYTFRFGMYNTYS